jgi:hypothetical protein
VSVAGATIASVLIDRFLPEFDVSEHHVTRVHAPVDRAYASARRVDLGRSKVIRGLFTARGIPLAIRRRPRPKLRSLTLDDLVRDGFVWLAQEPPHELVLGVAGSFWRPSARMLHLDATDFEAFDGKGYAKAAWNFRVIPLDETRSVVTTETRVRVPDDESRRKFLLYWAAIGPMSGLIRRQALALIKDDAEARPGPQVT